MIERVVQKVPPTNETKFTISGKTAATKPESTRIVIVSMKLVAWQRAVGSPQRGRPMDTLASVKTPLLSNGLSVHGVHGKDALIS